MSTRICESWLQIRCIPKLVKVQVSRSFGFGVATLYWIPSKTFVQSYFLFNQCNMCHQCLPRMRQFCSTNDSGILIHHTFRLSTYQIKVDKCQKLFSFLSHFQKNAWNCRPSTFHFQPNGKNCLTVILHNFLNMPRRWK